jgi:hypothetical protein
MAIVPKDEFERTLESQLDELWDHANSGPNNVETVIPEVTLRGSFRSTADLARLGKASDAGGQARFEMWWTNCPSRGMPKLLWDRWDCVGLTRADYEAMLAAAENIGPDISHVVDDKEWLGELAPLKPLPTWKYHPERMRGVMPFAARVAQIGRQCRGSPSVEELNDLVEAWQAPPGYDIAARPLRERIHSASRNSRAMFHIVDMLMLNAVFCANGRQIFDLPPQLCEMFRETDVDDIAAEHIKVPYPGVYLHFGPQPDLALNADWTPEGAYVHEIRGDASEDRVLQFCVVSAPTDLERYREFDVHIEPVYVQSLGPQHMKMALGEAVDMVLAEKMKQLRKEVMEEPMAKPDKAAQELAAEHGIQLVSAQAARAQGELDGLEPMHRTYLEMLKLIVNSLAYLTAYPKDVETTWPRNTPAHLLKDLSRTENRNEQRRIQSKLAALGFTPVHICGRKLAAELDRQAAASGDRHPAAHWRRGHWRRQPHGPQNTLRKLVWLMPTLVNPGKSAEEVPGHLYLVS